MQERVFGLEFEYSLAHLPEPGMVGLDSSSASRRAVEIADQQLRQVGRGSNFWPNGGKLYYDVGHVEWATPECRTLRQAVTFDKAGERLMGQIATTMEQDLASGHNRGTLQIAKNNIDAHHHTFGCHENYLVQRTSDFIRSREDFFDYAIRKLVPFLVTRSIICGSGTVSREGKFQLTQRAPFINSAVASDTRDTKSIINTRDEALAEAGKYRRLHLILGDANMAEWATFLKLGITALVLEMIEDAFLEIGDSLPELTSPVDALHIVSSDVDLKIQLPLSNGRKMTALEIQRCYLDAAQYYFADCRIEETNQVLEMWSKVLTQLEEDPSRLVGKLDWVTKKTYLETVVAENGWKWNDPRVREIDLNYHSVRPETSVFHLLKEMGLIETLVTDEEIESALTNPPSFTRAQLRAEAMRRDAEILDWDEITPAGTERTYQLHSPLNWCHLQTLRALGLNQAALLSWLSKGLASENPAIRIQALNELSKVKSLKTVTIVLESLNDTDRHVRAAAIEALGKLKAKQALNELRSALSDEHFVVRMRAEEAVGTLEAAK